MNKLESVILDQHARVKAAGANPMEALNESKGEILLAATRELTLEIISDYSRTSTPRETSSSNAMMRAQMNPRSVLNRSSASISNGHNLAKIGMLVPNQGYTGGIVFDHGDPIVYGHSTIYNWIRGDDPIQDAMGETFYPPMMWAKALRAEAYKNRPESAQQLSIAEYLSSLGLSLGSMVSKDGDIVGATGFMPGPRLQGEWGDEGVMDHIRSEEIEAFRLSGMCDQAVLDPEILNDPLWFATSILLSSGSLN